MQYLKKLLNSAEGFRFIFFVYLFLGIEYISMPSAGILVIWAGYLAVRKLLRESRIQRIRYRKILYCFLLGAVLTTALHAEKNLADNLGLICMMGIYFFLLYGMHGEESNFRCKREMKRILSFTVFMTTALMIMGLIGLAIFPKGFSWNGLPFILYESRFLGLLFNANVAGFYSAMAIIACHILWRMIRAEHRLSVRRKLLYIGCMAVNLLALFLSDSNASLLFLVVYCSFVMFYILFRDFSRKKIHGFLLRITATILSFIVIIASLMFFRVLTQSRVSLVMTSGHSETELSTGIIAEDGTVGLTDDEDRENLFGHENTNPDSGRFKIWKQSLQMYEKYPLLGIGKANIIDYGQEYVGGLRYDDFHNGFITILISYGLTGLHLFLIFSLTVAGDMLKTIFRYKKKCRDDGSVPVLITAFCAAYLVYAMFEPALLADMSYRVYIFWMLLGFGMSYVQKYRRQSAIEKDSIDQSVTDLPSAVERLRQKHHRIKQPLQLRL